MKKKQKEYFDTYIIKYKSGAFENPLYLVWYTDTDKDATDKFLTSSSSNIICFNRLDCEVVRSYFSWINIPLNVISDSLVCDVESISNNILKETLDDKTIESIVDFTNLFGDFAYQNVNNFHLKNYIEDEFINYIWNYFYEYIFFPKFYNKEVDRPHLNINYVELRNSFVRLISTFENYFEVIK